MISPTLEKDSPYLDGLKMNRQLVSFGYEDAYESSLLGHVGLFSTFSNSLEKPQSAFAGTGA